MYVGPSVTPSASAAARAASTAASDRHARSARRARARPRTRAARPRARSVTVSGTKRAADREGVHRHLGPVHELLEQREPAARGAERRLERVVQLRRRPRQHEPLLALPVRRLDHEREADSSAAARASTSVGATAYARLRHPGLGEPLALAQLRGRERGHLRRRAGAAARAAPRSAPRSRPGSRSRARSGRRAAPRMREPLDPDLVLGGDDRPPRRRSGTPARTGRGRPRS